MSLQRPEKIVLPRACSAYALLNTGLESKTGDLRNASKTKSKVRNHPNSQMGKALAWAQMYFDRFDKDRDGTIGRHDLARVLQRLDSNTWNDAYIDKLLNAMDTERDRQIGFKEFREFLFGHQWARERADFTIAMSMPEPPEEEEPEPAGFQLDVNIDMEDQRTLGHVQRVTPKADYFLQPLSRAQSAASTTRGGLAPIDSPSNSVRPRGMEPNMSRGSLGSSLASLGSSSGARSSGGSMPPSPLAQVQPMRGAADPLGLKQVTRKKLSRY